MNIFGRPVEWTISHLPKKYHTAISNISHKSIARAIDYACWTLPNQGDCWKRLHMTGAIAAGAAGGYFGIASLSVELPISTVVMLRSIAEIARTNGESLYSPKTRLACIQAARFSIVVKEKVIAQAVPVIGAVGGATINATFMDHFQDKA